ncbi:dihydroneopterin aldolase [Thauera sinica]|nr:dihydroneopterin aldolase [Thauera sp. K11]
MPHFFPVDPAPAGRGGEAPLDVIFIHGFVGETVIGIHHDELDRPQPLRIDLAAGVPRSLACDTDRIGDTIDYGEVRGALRELLRHHRHQLLEAFAEGVANLLLGRFGAHWVRVGITKPRKFDDVEGVGVLIERRRAHREPAAPRRDAEVLSLLASGMVPGGRGR